jgi:hypothetical protein
VATKAEIQKQIDALTASLEGADDDEEVWVKDDSGREFRFTGSRAASIIEKFGDLFTAADQGKGDGGGKGAGDGGGDGGAGKGAEDKPKGGYFGRKG